MCVEKSGLTMKVKHELTKSETERFLTTLNIPTCKCSTIKQQPINTNAKHSSLDDSITCISFDNDSSINSFSSASHKKKTKSISIKRIVTFIENPNYFDSYKFHINYKEDGTP